MKGNTSAVRVCALGSHKFSFLLFQCIFSAAPCSLPTGLRLKCTCYEDGIVFPKISVLADQAEMVISRHAFLIEV